MSSLLPKKPTAVGWITAFLAPHQHALVLKALPQQLIIVPRHPTGSYGSVPQQLGPLGWPSNTTAEWSKWCAAAAGQGGTQCCKTAPCLEEAARGQPVGFGASPPAVNPTTPTATSAACAWRFPACLSRTCELLATQQMKREPPQARSSPA